MSEIVSLNTSEPRDCFVYIVAKKIGEREFTAPIKFGVAANPHSRLREIQTHCPFSIGLFAAIRTPERPIAMALEHAFHTTQAKHCLHGEWFSIEPKHAFFLMHINLKVALKVKTDLSDDEISACMKMAFEGTDAA